MEFIRHIGELQCCECRTVESNRRIYYTQHEGKQLYWFVCGVPRCGAWTRVAFGYEEIGPLAPHLRREIPKISRFEDQNEVEYYATNW